ncbi:hypothetical protein JCM18899A_39380 [Nocardioides sp. AN3]
MDTAVKKTIAEVDGDAGRAIDPDGVTDGRRGGLAGSGESGQDGTLGAGGAVHEESHGAIRPRVSSLSAPSRTDGYRSQGSLRRAARPPGDLLADVPL